jgi:hypothetical protein
MIFSFWGQRNYEPNVELRNKKASREIIIPLEASGQQFPKIPPHIPLLNR